MEQSSSASKERPVSSLAPFGMPSGPPTSDRLWAHLLKKDLTANAPNVPSLTPPLAPFDKTATSMRILLHDTQTNFERFSGRVDKLITNVDEAKREIGVVNSLFQREHDALSGEFLDLVNRSQTEIQKSIGAPAQARNLEDLGNNLGLRFDSLDKRIDALQLLNQTFSQTMQAQATALQSLQEQQGTIITALLPLLPLLQAVPLHIENASTSIKEVVRTNVAVAPCNYPPRPPDVHPESLERPRKRRSSAGTSSDPISSPLAAKKPRRTGQGMDATNDSPTRSIRDLRISSPPRPSVAAPHTHSDVEQDPRPTPKVQTLIEPADPPADTTMQIVNPVTPRRPLADLPIPFSATKERTSSLIGILLTPTTSKTDASQPSAARRHDASIIFGGSAKKPPRMLRVHSSVSRKAIGSPMADPTRSDVPGTGKAMSTPPVPLMVSLTAASGAQSHLASARSPSMSREPTPLSSLQYRRIVEPLPPVRVQGMPPPVRQGSACPPLASSSAGVLPKPRRSPFREGRRFIPLVDSDEDEDEADG